MKMRNLTKEKLATNGYVLGAFVASGSTMNCECLGMNGMDFIIIDAEHAQTNCETMVHMTCASELYDMAAIVRVYDPSDTAMMARLLDVGIHGIMVPMVESREQADGIIRAVKFPPMGMRGVSGGRGPRWGLYEDYAFQSNEALYTIMQCESRKGVEQIEQIVQTPGLDCIFIGTADLAQDMGHSDDPNNHQVADAISRVLTVCQKYHVTAGIVTGSAEAAAAYIQKGFQLVTCLNDQVFFRTESGKRLQTIRQSLAAQQG